MAQCLPVRSIPKKFHIPFVWDDVVDAGGGGHSTGPLAVRAQGVFCKESLGGFAPLVRIAVLRGSAVVFLLAPYPVRHLFPDAQRSNDRRLMRVYDNQGKYG